MFGKQLLREYCLPETFVLLTALRELIGKDADPKTGRRLEDTILRFAVKVVLLYHHARLRPSDPGRCFLLDRFRPVPSPPPLQVKRHSKLRMT